MDLMSMLPLISAFTLLEIYRSITPHSVTRSMTLAFKCCFCS